MTITDEQLLQLIDGQLDDSASADLHLRIAADEDAATRLRLMTASDAMLRAAPMPDATGLDTLKAAIRSGTLDPRVEQSKGVSSLAGSSRQARMPAARRSSFITPLQMAACLAILTLGALGGYVGGSVLSDSGEAEMAGQPTWVMRVVDYHTLYGRETVTPAKASRETIASLQQTFENALNNRMHIPTMGGRKLEFRRGQVLRFKETPIIQLAYLPDETGAPVALCLRPSSKPDAKPEYVSLRGMGVVRWRRNGLDYILVGHRMKEDLLADADRAISEIVAAETI